MGLYSTNKINSVSTVAEGYNETLRELDEAVADSRLGDIMEVVIEMHENDKRMFDSLLEADFISCVNESYLTEEENEKMAEVSNEKKKGKIAEFITNIFTQCMNAIKTFFANVMKKLEEFFSANAQLDKRYSEALKTADFSKFSGIANIEFPTESSSVYATKSVKGKNEVIAKFKEAIGKINNSTNAEELNTEYENFTVTIEQAEKNLSEISDNCFKKYYDESPFIPKRGDVLIIINTIRHGKEAKDIMKTACAKTLGDLKTAAAEANKAINEAKKKNDEFEVAKLNRVANMSSSMAKYFSKEFKNQFIIVKKQIAACRKAAIICGKYALNPTHESASLINWAIMESSDRYVEEFFEY